MLLLRAHSHNDERCSEMINALQLERTTRVCECVRPYKARGGRAHTQDTLLRFYGVTTLILLYHDTSLKYFDLVNNGVLFLQNPPAPEMSNHNQQHISR